MMGFINSVHYTEIVNYIIPYYHIGVLKDVVRLSVLVIVLDLCRILLELKAFKNADNDELE